MAALPVKMDKRSFERIMTQHLPLAVVYAVVYNGSSGYLIDRLERDAVA